MLSLQHISVTVTTHNKKKVTILHDISFDVTKGSMFAFI